MDERTNPVVFWPLVAAAFAALNVGNAVGSLNIGALAGAFALLAAVAFGGRRTTP